MRQKTTLILLFLSGVVGNLLSSCSTDDGDGFANVFLYKNTTNHKVDLEKYRDNSLVGVESIAPMGTLQFKMIQGSGETLLLYEKVRIVFDNSSVIVFIKANENEPHSVFELDNYQDEKQGKTKMIHTYTFTEELYNMAIPIS